MKYLNFIILILVTLLSCKPSQTSNNASQSVTMKDFKNKMAYQKLSDTDDLKNFVGQRVQFQAKLCRMEMQHMLRGSFDGVDSYICIDRVNEKGENIRQILAYTAKDDRFREEFNGKQFTVFGVVGKISGAGKGGGTHTEYYLELDKVE